MIGWLQANRAAALDEFDAVERVGPAPFGPLERIESARADQEEIVIGADLRQLALIESLPQQAFADRRRGGERQPEIDERLVWFIVLGAEQSGRVAAGDQQPLHRALGEQGVPGGPAQGFAVEPYGAVRNGTAAAPDYPRRPDDGIADHGAGDGRARHGMRAARQIAGLFERGAAADIEALEGRDIGRERVPWNADHENRFFMRHDPGAGDDALGRDRGDDIERTAGIADRAGHLVGRERIAENSAIGGPDNGGRRFSLRLFDRGGTFRWKEFSGDPEVGGLCAATRGQRQRRENAQHPGGP